MPFNPKFQKMRHTRTGWYYSMGLFSLTFGLTYLFPLFYKTFCEATGYTGQGVKQQGYDPKTMHDPKKIHRKYEIQFKGNCEPDLKWSFFPLQDSVTINPGETVLAFFRAFNAGSEAMIGISAYIVQPDEVVQYFNKIQCFCFERQVLEPGQTMDFPVSFSVDPEIQDDPNLDDVKTITLSYTFFPARDADSGEAGAALRN